MKTQEITPFVSVKKKGREINIQSTYTIFYKKNRSGGRVSCAIPSFDIYYSVDAFDRDKVVDKGRRILKMYFDHFMVHSKNKIKDFVIQIHKLGFRASNDSLMIRKIMDSPDSQAKFSSQKLTDPSLQNENFEKVNEELELAF